MKEDKERQELDQLKLEREVGQLQYQVGAFYNLYPKKSSKLILLKWHHSINNRLYPKWFKIDKENI